MNIELHKIATALKELTKQNHKLLKEMKELKLNEGTSQNSDLQGWIFINQVKEILGVSTSTIYRYIDNGSLLASKVGSRYLFKVEDINKLLERNYQRFEANASDDDQI